jgi:hypothetical protein
MITRRRLKELLNYDPETGHFTWKFPPNGICGPQKVPGTVAGSSNTRGYIQIRIDGVRYYAHRLAFLYMKGRWPWYTDHKDGITHHNWFSNLRECTPQQSAWNRVTHNKLGIQGVYKHPRGGYSVFLCGKYLAHTKDLKKAARAYYMAASEKYGEFANRLQPY